MFYPVLLTHIYENITLLCISDDSVFMMQAPPPYPGIDPNAQPYPPQGPPQSSQANGYPPAGPSSAAGEKLRP